MATQYEVEHNIKTPSGAGRRRRQVDMSTFDSHLHAISTSSPDPQQQPHQPAHLHATPVDMAALFRLVQDQLGTLARDAPNEANRSFLVELAEALEADIQQPPTEVPGVPQEDIDSLDRVPRKQLADDAACPICAERYLDDPYALVVELPCHHSHRFDLECVAPWLKSKGTCPLCRKDLAKKKAVIPASQEDEEGDEDPDMLYS